MKEQCFHKVFLPEWVQKDEKYDIGEEELNKTSCYKSEVGNAKIDPERVLITKEKKLSGNRKKLVKDSRKIISEN